MEEGRLIPVPEGGSSILALFRAREPALLRQIRSGDEKAAVGILNELMGCVLFDGDGSREAVRLGAMELTVLLSRLAAEAGADADGADAESRRLLSRMLRSRDPVALCGLLREVAEAFMDTVFRKKSNAYIRSALRYIGDHYAQHLTLDQVAGHVHLNSCYFSSLFREVMGISFREYLCRVRVEESKRLLLDGRMSTLTDIAVAVGFPDQSYFCKIFKRMVGMTPGRYRSGG